MATSFRNMPAESQIGQTGNGAVGNGKCATLSMDIPLASVLNPSTAASDFSGWNELLRIGRRYVQKFLSMLPVILHDEDRGAVHKMRIVSRRVELIVTLIYAKPMPPHARKLRARARRCRHLLGDLADCDVLLKMAERSLARDPSRDRSAWKAVEDFIQRRRAKILPRILESLTALDFAGPAAKVQRDLEQNGASRRVYSDGRFQKLPPEKADKIVQQRILHSLAHLWRNFESLVEETRDDPCEQVIHGLRIATKRLRHLVEVMKKLQVGGSPEILGRLREVQRAIGEWHDMEVLEHITSDLLIQKRFVRDHLELAVEIEELFLRNREIKKTSEERFRRMAPNSRDYREIKEWVAAKLRGRKAHISAILQQPAAFPTSTSVASNGSGLKQVG